MFGEIQHLRDCISALFQFLRKPTEDEDFYNDITLWLENLVCFLVYFIIFTELANYQILHVYTGYEILALTGPLGRTVEN